MAYTNPGLTATTHALYVKHKIVDGVLLNNAFWRRVKSMGKMHMGKGGTQIGPGTIRSSTLTVQNWAPMDVPVISQPNIVTQGYHQWTGLIGHYLLSQWDAWGNQGKPEAIEYMQQTYLEALKADFETAMEQAVFLNGSTSVPAGITGLPGFMKQTGSYGNIAQTNSYWQPYTLVGSAQTPTYFLNPYLSLRKARQFAIKGTGDRKENQINLIVMPQAEHIHLSNYMYTTFGRITAPEDDIDFGSDAAMIDQVPVIWDPYCTANTVYLLNMRYFHLYSGPSELLHPRSGEFNHAPVAEWHQILAKWQLVNTSPRNQSYITGTGVS